MNPVLPANLPLSKTFAFKSAPDTPAECKVAYRSIPHIKGPLPATMPLVDA